MNHHPAANDKSRRITAFRPVHGLVGRFETPELLVEAAKKRAYVAGYTGAWIAYSPVPVEGLAAALGRGGPPCR